MPGQIIVGTLIDAPTYEALRVRTNHVCIVGLNGRIVAIKPVDPKHESPSEQSVRSSLPEEYQDFPIYLMGEHEFVCPGMVDCHNHAPQVGALV
jgi:guanine deaminase